MGDDAGMSAGGGGQSCTRLFFALWPDDNARAMLGRVVEAARHECVGRPMQPRNLHLTLAFLGDTDAGHRDAAVAAASHLRVAPFDLCIERGGYFKQGRDRGIVWAGCDTPALLAALVEDLRTALREAGVPFDTKPFVPHVTLLRDARAPRVPFAVDPVSWPVRDFALVVSTRDEQGPLYRIDAGPFGGGAAHKAEGVLTKY